LLSKKIRSFEEKRIMRTTCHVPPQYIGYIRAQ
jgi:hypothetical protein